MPNYTYRIVKRDNGFKIRKITNDGIGFLWDSSVDTYSTPEEAKSALESIENVRFVASGYGRR